MARRVRCLVAAVGGAGGLPRAQAAGPAVQGHTPALAPASPHIRAFAEDLITRARRSPEDLFLLRDALEAAVQQARQVRREQHLALRSAQAQEHHAEELVHDHGLL